MRKRGSHRTVWNSFWTWVGLVDRWERYYQNCERLRWVLLIATMIVTCISNGAENVERFRDGLCYQSTVVWGALCFDWKTVPCRSLPCRGAPAPTIRPRVLLVYVFVNITLLELSGIRVFDRLWIEVHVSCCFARNISNSGTFGGF